MSADRFPPFRPHPLVRSGHAQTLLAFYLQAGRFRYQATQHMVKLDDGDTLALHDDSPPRWVKGDRVVLLVPGLDGSHQSPYMPRISAKLNARGHRTFRMDLRGCGAGYHLAKLPAHAGRSEDAVAAIEKIRELCPDSPVTAVGFSMGGNIVLKMLGEIGDVPLGKLDSGIAIAPPIDILACSLHLLRLPNLIYSRSLARSLLRKVRRRRPFVEAMQQIPLHPRPKNLLEFDDRFTAPLSGFRGVRDYYAHCSARPVLPRVALPTLIITAADDPMIPVSIFDAAEFSPPTSLVVTEGGGHIGYLGASGVDPDRRWMDWRIVDWIDWHTLDRAVNG